MKVVLDTNVIVSGLLRSQGKPARILNLALSGAIQIIHNPSLLAEYADVLPRPRFKFDPERVRDVLAKIETDGTSMEITGMPPLELPDADDECFLAVALAGNADYLVTGNLADYPEDKRKGCNVVSPSEFLIIWEETQK